MSTSVRRVLRRAALEAWLAHADEVLATGPSAPADRPLVEDPVPSYPDELAPDLARRAR